MRAVLSRHLTELSSLRVAGRQLDHCKVASSTTVKLSSRMCMVRGRCLEQRFRGVSVSARVRAGTSVATGPVIMSRNRKKETTTDASGVGGTMEPGRDRVAMRAYELYLERGAAGGRELDDWLEA